MIYESLFNMNILVEQSLLDQLTTALYTISVLNISLVLICCYCVYTVMSRR